MRLRRVLLCLPERPSKDALALARAIKAALSDTHQIRLHLAGGNFDDDETPVEALHKQPLILKVEDPPDGGEGTV